MREEEALRGIILDRVVKGEMTAESGAARLEMSKRQMFRLKKRFKESGMAGLAHGNRKRKPANVLSAETRALVIEKGTGEYKGASLSHMAELLERNDDVRISAKSIGRILKEAGVKNPHGRRSPKKHKRRERRERFGELIQMDASPFDWLERGETWSLHGAIDDATSKVLSLRFEKNECSTGYLHVLRDILGTYGVPASLYSDRHGIFFSPKGEKLSDDDIVEGRRAPLTQYGQALHLLGIEHIPARTPQAKGRIERLWGTLQHRLVVEMRNARVATMEEANAFLAEYMKLHNALFVEKAASDASDFLPAPAPEKLRLILGRKEERKALPGSEISWKGQKYRLADEAGRTTGLRKGETITVILTMDGELQAIRDDEKEAVYGLIVSPARDGKEKKKRKESGDTSHDRAKTKTTATTPSPSHPWRETRDKSARHRYIENDLDPMEIFDNCIVGSISGVRVS